MTSFIDSGERFSSLFDARVAAHDYAHEGYYFRVVRLADREWGVWVKWGRIYKLRCCQPKKRTYVPEPMPSATWKPRKKLRLVG